LDERKLMVGLRRLHKILTSKKSAFCPLCCAAY